MRSIVNKENFQAQNNCLKHKYDSLNISRVFTIIEK